MNLPKSGVVLLVVLFFGAGLSALSMWKKWGRDRRLRFAAATVNWLFSAFWLAIFGLVAWLKVRRL